MPAAFGSVGAVGSIATEAASTVSLGMPASISNGDLLVACLTHSSSKTVTASGWTALTSQTEFTVLWRVANGSESDPTVFDYGGAAYFMGTGAVVRFTGATSTGISIGTTVTRATDDTQVDLPSATPTAGDALIWLGTWFDNASPPAVNSCSRGSSVERVDGRGGTWGKNLYLYTEDNLTAGATGTATMTIASSKTNKRGNVVIVPASSGSSPVGPLIGGRLTHGGILIGGRLVRA